MLPGRRLVPLLLFCCLPSVRALRVLQSPGEAQDEGNSSIADTSIFHFILSTGPDTVTPLKQRMLESIFYHHPRATVQVRVLNKNFVPMVDKLLQPLRDLGFHATALRYSLYDDCLGRLMNNSFGLDPAVVQSFWDGLPTRIKPHWYSHQTDLARLCLLYYDGGAYFDTDALLVKPFKNKLMNVIAIEDESTHVANGAVMRFEAGNKFLAACLKEFVETYRGRCWSCNGPWLLTRVANRSENVDHVHVLDHTAFYAVSMYNVTDIFWKKSLNDTEVVAARDLIENRSTAVHFYSKSHGEGKDSAPTSLAKYLINKYCVICNRSLFPMLEG